MSHIVKLILKILLNRMKTKIRQEISQEQNAYMEGKGTRNAIFVLRMLAERSLEVQKDIYLRFIDYSKAFDKVRYEELFRILEALDIYWKDLQLSRNLYWEQTAAIQIEGEMSTWTSIKRGVRQGCVLSPDLFNLYSEVILREVKDIPGVKIGGVNINNLRYADDTALLAENEAGLQNILNKVVTESEKKGLQINIKKTECMVISKKSTPPKCSLVDY